MNDAEEKVARQCALVAPYFHTRLIEKVSVAPHCCMHHAPLAQTPAPACDILPRKGAHTVHCAHQCTIESGQIAGSFLWNGTLLFHLIELGLATADDETRSHLQRHSRADLAEYARKCLGDPDTVLLCSAAQLQLQELPFPANDSFTTVPLLSPLGRFVERYLIQTGGRAFDPSLSYFLSADRSLIYINGIDARRRMADFWKAEYAGLLAPNDRLHDSLTLDPVASRDAVCLLLGTPTLSPAPSPPRPPSLHPCCACNDAEVQVILLPCAHLCYCDQCARTALGLVVGNTLPSGHPQPRAGARCPICSIYVATLLRCHFA